MMITKIYVGWFNDDTFANGAFELTLRNPISEEEAREKAQKLGFTENDFVEDMNKQFPQMCCSYSYYMTREDAIRGSSL